MDFLATAVNVLGFIVVVAGNLVSTFVASLLIKVVKFLWNLFKRHFYAGADADLLDLENPPDADLPDDDEDDADLPEDDADLPEC